MEICVWDQKGQASEIQGKREKIKMNCPAPRIF